MMEELTHRIESIVARVESRGTQGDHDAADSDIADDYISKLTAVKQVQKWR